MPVLNVFATNPLAFELENIQSDTKHSQCYKTLTVIEMRQVFLCLFYSYDNLKCTNQLELCISKSNRVCAAEVES